MSSALPILFMGCLAASIDGVIHPARSPEYVQLGSPSDIAHLLSLRDSVDGVLVGGETFRQYPSHHVGHNKDHVPVVGIFTRGESDGKPLEKSLPPYAPLFTQRAVPELREPPPILVFCTNLPTPSQQAQYPAHVQWHHIFPEDTAGSIAVMEAAYAACGVERLLCEGGGELIGWLIGAKRLNELYLTQCPFLLGGVGRAHGSVPLVGGPGFTQHESPTMTLLSQNCYETKQGTECIQHWQLGYHPA